MTALALSTRTGIAMVPSCSQLLWSSLGGSALQFQDSGAWHTAVGFWGQPLEVRRDEGATERDAVMRFGQRHP